MTRFRYLVFTYTPLDYFSDLLSRTARKSEFACTSTSLRRRGNRRRAPNLTSPRREFHQNRRMFPFVCWVLLGVGFWCRLFRFRFFSPPIRLVSFHTFQDARTSAQRQGCSLIAGSPASEQEQRGARGEELDPSHSSFCVTSPNLKPGSRAARLGDAILSGLKGAILLPAQDWRGQSCCQRRIERSNPVASAGLWQGERMVKKRAKSEAWSEVGTPTLVEERSRNSDLGGRAKSEFRPRWESEVGIPTSGGAARRL